jgi:L-serine deaminase
MQLDTAANPAFCGLYQIAMGGAALRRCRCTTCRYIVAGILGILPDRWRIPVQPHAVRHRALIMFPAAFAGDDASARDVRICRSRRAIGVIGSANVGAIIGLVSRINIGLL